MAAGLVQLTKPFRLPVPGTSNARSARAFGTMRMKGLEPPRDLSHTDLNRHEEC